MSPAGTRFCPEWDQCTGLIVVNFCRQLLKSFFEWFVCLEMWELVFYWPRKVHFISRRHNWSKEKTKAVSMALKTICCVLLILFRRPIANRHPICTVTNDRHAICLMPSIINSWFIRLFCIQPTYLSGTNHSRPERYLPVPVQMSRCLLDTTLLNATFSVAFGLDNWYFRSVAS